MLRIRHSSRGRFGQTVWAVRASHGASPQTTSAPGLRWDEPRLDEPRLVEVGLLAAFDLRALWRDDRVSLFCLRSSRRARAHRVASIRVSRSSVARIATARARVTRSPVNPGALEGFQTPRSFESSSRALSFASGAVLVCIAELRISSKFTASSSSKWNRLAMATYARYVSRIAYESLRIKPTEEGKQDKSASLASLDRFRRGAQTPVSLGVARVRDAERAQRARGECGLDVHQEPRAKDGGDLSEGLGLVFSRADSPSTTRGLYISRLRCNAEREARQFRRGEAALCEEGRGSFDEKRHHADAWVHRCFERCVTARFFKNALSCEVDVSMSSEKNTRCCRLSLLSPRAAPTRRRA